MATPKTFDLDLAHKKFQIAITDDDALELWVDGCLRKRRDPSERDPLYVWTNIELHWEEHRYVEARYFRKTGQLQVTVNGDAVLQQSV